MIEINRALISKAFKKLDDHVHGRAVDPDDIAHAIRPADPMLYLVGGHLLLFDERRCQPDDYHVLFKDEHGKLNEIPGPLGGLAVGDRLEFPKELPPKHKGVRPLMLVKLVCPVPGAGIRSDSPPATVSQHPDAFPVYLALTENAVTNGDAEYQQPLRTVTQYMLRVLAEGGMLYDPPQIARVGTP